MRGRFRGGRSEVFFKKISALADGQGADVRNAFDRGTDADGGRKGEKHRMVFIYRGEFFSDGAGRRAKQEFSVFHDRCPVGDGKDFFETVFRENDGQTEFAVEFFQHRNELGRGDRVELTRRFVEQEQFGLHDRDGREIKKLFLSAGEFVRVFAEKVGQSEPAGDLSDAAADDLGRNAEIFKPVREFVPNFVGHDLFFGILHDKTDLGGAFAVGKFFGVPAPEKDLSAFFARRRKFFFQKFQKRCFSAARRAAKNNEFTLVHAQADAVDGVFFARGICECQIFDTQYFHASASLTSMMNGTRESSPNAA